MTPVSTNIKIDPILKKEAQALFEKLGLNLSTAVNIFLRQSVREQGIPFYVSAEEPNAETRKAIEDGRKGIGLHGPFHSVEELMEDLNADD